MHHFVLLLSAMFYIYIANVQDGNCFDAFISISGWFIRYIIFDDSFFYRSTKRRVCLLLAKTCALLSETMHKLTYLYTTNDKFGEISSFIFTHSLFHSRQSI